MRMGHLDYRPEAFSPWGKQVLLPRIVQPLSVSLAGATEIPTAPASDIPPSETGASFTTFIPAFDFQPRRLGVRAGYVTNVAKEGTQDHGESNPQTRGTANV